MSRYSRALFLCLFACALFLNGCACSTVEQGYRGAKINLYGSEKGAIEEKGPGRYWYVPFGVQFVELPVHVQRYALVSSRTEESPVDESFEAVSADNLAFRVGMSLQYYVNPKPGCVTEFYRKYKTGDFRRFSRRQARDIIRENARDVFGNFEASYIYGEGQSEVNDEITTKVKTDFKTKVSLDGESCIVVDNLGFAELVPPQSVKTAVEKKMKAAQRAQEEKSKLQQQIYASRKDSVKAAQDAENNRIITQSLSPELLEYKRLELMEKKWDGQLPRVMTGESGILLDVGNQ